MRILHPGRYLQAFTEINLLLKKHRQLLFAMTRREITDRYVGQIFGTLWAVGHPLILMVVYVFIFVFVFKFKFEKGIELPRDFVTYLLAGLIPWIALQETMVKACTAVVSNANLVKQVVFPLEVLAIKGVLASLLTELIAIVFLFAYGLVKYHTLPWTYALLPVFIVVQFMLMTGVSLLLASAGVFFRDLKDFIQVFCTVGFYMLPIFYSIEQFPEHFRFMLYCNPFTVLILCAQDILYYGRIEHPWAWWIFVLGSLLLFCGGYRLFRRIKPFFGGAL